MAAEVLFLGDSDSGKSAFINLLLGVAIMPESARSKVLPAIRLLADQPAGAWLRRDAQELSTPPLYSWSEIPADWNSFEYAEMTIEGHPLFNEGIIVWDAPCLNADDVQQQEYLQNFLNQRESIFSSVLFFISGTITRKTIEFLLQRPRLLERTTIVILIKDLKSDSQCREIERSVRDAVKKTLNTINVELVYIGDIWREFLFLAEERRNNYLDAELIRHWEKVQIDVDALAAKYERKNFRSHLIGVVKNTVSGVAVDFQTMNNVVLLSYSDLGNDEARIVLARRLMSNHEYAAAIRHYEVLAGKDHPEALTTLAQCFDAGNGVKFSKEMAEQYWHRAADVGVVEAQFQYAHILSSRGEDPSLAMPYLKKAADAGHVKANAELGKAYFTGIDGEKKYVKAIPYLTAAANAGEEEALYLLGKCYSKGWGVQKDVRKAVEFWEAAGKKNQSAALVDLGDLFMVNVDRPRNADRAFQYYLKTAELNDPAGFFRVGSCYDRGEGIPQDAEKAIEYYQLAAEKGFVMAQHNLGICYSEGQGGERDIEKAKYWLGRAADSGYEPSILALKEIEAEEEKQAKKKCFVVTAAFGDISAPEVVFFRQYRDTHLRQSRTGRILISIYDRIGPGLADIIRHHDILMRLSRRGLRRLMACLRR
jgi:TPR repeat protein